MSGKDRRMYLSGTGRPSRRWRRRALAALAIVLLAGSVWFMARQLRQQPVYDGRGLTVWLRTYAPSSPARRNSREWKEADEAVGHLGTNCLPVLLQMIRERDSRLKLQLVALAGKQRVVKTHFVPAAELNVEASRAFIVLGDVGKDAVPALVKAYDENVSDQSRRAIADALGWIGPAARPAVPMLLQASTNFDPGLRANALWALGEIHAGPQWCVPELIHALGDANGWARLSAAHALGRFGSEAQAAVPKLTEMSTFRPSASMDWQESLEARNALKKICPSVETFPAFDFPISDSQFSPRAPLPARSSWGEGKGRDDCGGSK